MNKNILANKKVFILLASLLFSISNLMSMAPPSLSMQASHRGAGILPYTKYKKGNKKVKRVVLGREKGKGTYSDFAGKPHRGGEEPWMTAAREFTEEAISKDTLGMDKDAVLAYIKPYAGNTKYIIAYFGHHDTTYITHFPKDKIDQLLKNFYSARAKATKHRFREKDRIATVNWHSLKDAIKQSAKSQVVQVWAKVVDPNTGKGKWEFVTLRNYLVNRLRPFFQDKAYVLGRDPTIRFY